MPEQSSLFGSLPEEKSKQDTAHASPMSPLAARMRPQKIDEIVGQEHLLGPGRALRKAIESDTISSMILWGPPGSGKTTLANTIAQSTNAEFATVSAVSAGVADLRKVIEQAKLLRKNFHRKTILFIDEIHRFNKAQQDAVLPYVESGDIILIGATTENPSFEVNSALLSRSRVYTLHALSDDHVKILIERALADVDRGIGNPSISISEDALTYLVQFANGDARAALNALEMSANFITSNAENSEITVPVVEDVLQKRVLLYDKSGEEHYNLISALHKSLRGSDPDAGLYWLGRMLEAGEDPLYIARRLIRFASEDIGMADPQALVICMAAQQAVHFIGIPEGGLALAQAVVYLATAPKSNALYQSYSAVQNDIQQTRNDPVPLHLRNAPTRLMKELDYGKDYIYAHTYYKENEDSEFPDRPPVERLQEYLPESIKDHQYYHPTSQGQEKSIHFWLKKRRESAKD